MWRHVLWFRHGDSRRVPSPMVGVSGEGTGIAGGFRGRADRDVRVAVLVGAAEGTAGELGVSVYVV